MAIYKVTDTKTGQTTTTGDLRYLYAKLHNIKDVQTVDGDEYTGFITALTQSPDFQTALHVTIETVTEIDAIKTVRKEMEDATARQKRAKEDLRQFTAITLSNVKDDNGERNDDDEQSTYKQVNNIISASKQAPVNVLKWFESKDKKGNTTQTKVAGVTLPAHVTRALERIAETRHAERTGNET